MKRKILNGVGENGVGIGTARATMATQGGAGEGGVGAALGHQTRVVMRARRAGSVTADTVQSTDDAIGVVAGIAALLRTQEVTRKIASERVTGARPGNTNESTRRHMRARRTHPPKMVTMRGGSGRRSWRRRRQRSLQWQGPRPARSSRAGGGCRVRPLQVRK